MADRAKRILKQLLDIWNKYTSKQKTLIISAICVVVFALALLVFLMQRTDYRKLTVAESVSDAAAITELLKSNEIKYDVGDDNITISVDSTKYTDAMFVMASNDMPSTGITIDDLLANSLSTTNADRNLKINLYMQNQIRNRILKMEGIEDAEVDYIPKDTSSSILKEAEDTSASVFLTTNPDFEVKTARTIAEVVANVIGNSSADSVKVADQYGNLLVGGEEDLNSGTISGVEDYKERLTSTFKNNLYAGLIKSGYDDVVIMPNLKFNMKVVSELLTEYTPAEGQEQGLYGHSYTYESENANTSGGTPGTDSNDATTYTTQDTSSTDGKVDIQEYDYLPNKKETNTQYEVGAIVPEESSISLVLVQVVTNKEVDLEAQGLLTGITFDQYAAQNSAQTIVIPDQSLFELVAAATGIAVANIQISAFQQPVFVPATVDTRSWTDYLQIILAVLIIALLVFVVFKGVKPVEVTELEPELSVEQLLATTKENQTIEDIEFNEVSEVRRMIEKFVDEKPEAVAQLLRNWLNEDWN